MANFWPQIKPLFSVESIENHPHFHTIRWTVIVVLLAIAGGLGWQLYSFYQVNFYPQTFINGVEVSNLTVPAATEKLLATHPLPPSFDLVVSTNDTFIASSSAELQARYPYQTAVSEVFARSHGLNLWDQLQRMFGTQHYSYATPIVLNETASLEFMAHLAKQVNKNSQPASIALKTPGATASLVIQPGIAGAALDETATTQAISQTLAGYSLAWRDPAAWQALSPTKLSVTAVTTTSKPPLTTAEQTTLLKVAETLVGKSLTLMVQRQSFVWNDSLLVSLLNPYLDPTKPETYLDQTQFETELSKISQALPNQPIDAEFEYDPATMVVKKFNPGKDGLVLDKADSKSRLSEKILAWMAQDNTAAKLQTLELKAEAQHPEKTLASTNDLGINEVVGFGESYYAHSIPTRVHNVALTANRINLTLIKPGETFSFNKALGEVSAATGFKPAYVIKSGRTELGDGGGVCQVSSTMFRAALNGGLNITLRRPHSYRVTYYELNSQPGFDATVYAGDVDFRFTNDTPGHLLVYTETDSKKLWMKVEIYGTKDGRVSEISDYKMWGASPAKPTEYIVDASLPPGTKKQIDWPAAGLKTSFVYTVKDSAGNIKQKATYASSYQPWSAKFLVGP